MKFFKNPAPAVDWLIAAVLGALAALVYFTGMVDYAYPGEPVALLSAWSGLEDMPSFKYPLLSWFNVHLAGGHSLVLAPLCGVACTVAIYLFVRGFLRRRIGREYLEADAVVISRLGGLVAAAVFAFTPAVHGAATRLDPRIFVAAWTMLGLSLLQASVKVPKGVAWTMPILAGVTMGLGTGDSAVFLALMPFVVLASWKASRLRGGKGYGAATLLVLAYLTTALIFVPVSHGGFSAYAAGQKDVFAAPLSVEMVYCLPLFTILPFIVAIFSCRSAFSGGRSRMQIWYHALMTLFAILAAATPLSASSLMKPTRYAPVLSCAFAACTCGYLMAYWWSITRTARLANESLEGKSAPRSYRPFGYTIGGFLALVLVLKLVFDFCIGSDEGTFRGESVERGQFADLVAERIVADMGARTWLVTDGRLDSHLRLAAKKAGKELNLICLQKENDPEYIENLAALAEKKGLGAYCARLRKFGILQFIQDWFLADPEVGRHVAVFGAPDIWYQYAPKADGSRRDAVPELFFFGGEKLEKEFDFDEFRAYAGLLTAPGSWDNYSMLNEKDPLVRLRLSLRRHLGFVACVWGCTEDAAARKAWNIGNEAEAARHFEKAFEIYDFVRTEIDSGNLCALLNELDLIDTVLKDNPKAQGCRKDVANTLNEINKDEQRRRYYTYCPMSLFFGYIMNPQALIRVGLRSLEHGANQSGISTLLRAGDLMPNDARRQLELGILAPAYAMERGANREKSKKMYTNYIKDFEAGAEDIVLNPDSLVSLVRLAILFGDTENADKMLLKIEDAVREGRYEPGVQFYAMKASYHLMRGQLGPARAAIQSGRDLEPDNPSVWAMLAIVSVRQLEEIEALEEKEARANAGTKEKIVKELDEVILPTLDRLGPKDPVALKAKSIVKVYRGVRETDGAARHDLLMSAREDLLAVAARQSNDAATGDRLLGLDMQLGLIDEAIKRAEDILFQDSKSALANYAIGSNALENNDRAKARKHLAAAVESAPDNPLMLNDYAELLRLEGELVEAEKHARHALSKAPQFSLVWDTLGVILLDTGKKELLPEAESCIRKACVLSGNAEPRLLMSLARVLARQGKQKEAQDALRKSKEILDKAGLPADHSYRKEFSVAEDEVLKL